MAGTIDGTARKTKLSRSKISEREIKRVAEEEPIIPIVEVARPVQVSLALRVIPPHITGLLVALEGFVEKVVCATASRRSFDRSRS